MVVNQFQQLRINLISGLNLHYLTSYTYRFRKISHLNYVKLYESIVPHQYACLLIPSLLLLCHFNTEAQTISGKVLDHKTNEPIPYVNIYFNNSYNGTSSDIDGHFELNIGQNPGQDIVVSCMGYKSQLIQDYISGGYYKVYLYPQTYLLKEIVVLADDVSREKMEKVFLEEFLGRTRNAKQCEIENLNDVRLGYDKSSGTLVAFCSKPLIISNKALGYRIKYFLEEFEKSKERTDYLGYSIFEENTSFSKQEIVRIKKRREKAYFGSRMHFFRILWKDELHRSKFNVIDFGQENEANLESSIEVKNPNVKSLFYPDTLKILYTKNRVSYLYFSSIVIFTRKGYFDPEGLYWQGDMAKQRVGDLLPYEYIPTSKNH